MLTSDVLSARDKKASKHESEPTASEPQPEEEALAAEEQPRRARYVKSIYFPIVTEPLHDV